VTRPPDGPTGDQFPVFEEDPYRYLVDLRRYGDHVAIDLGGIPTVVVYDLDSIHRVFADKLEHIGLPAALGRLRHATGSGLLTNYDWATWSPRRRHLVKPLGARAVGHFHARMIRIIDETLASWPVGRRFDLYPEVRFLALRIVADLLFTEDLTTEATRVIERAVDEIHAWAEADPSNADIDTEPESFRTAIDDLYRFIAGVVNRRDPADPGHDMVGVLLGAAADPGVPLDATGVCDEAVTLILAGHETVTATISFALDLVGRHPATACTDARHIVDETLRMFPPVHMTTKAVTADLDIGGFTIPAGWEILIPEYVIFRDPHNFDLPDEFRPDRWADESRLHLERRAYFPFLTGPKFCIGSHFALMEATEVVGRFMDRYRHRMLDPEPPRGRPFALTFAPDRPLPCELEHR
jgi:cytochrome P450